MVSRSSFRFRRSLADASALRFLFSFSTLEAVLTSTFASLYRALLRLIPGHFPLLRRLRLPIDLKLLHHMEDAADLNTRLPHLPDFRAFVQHHAPTLQVQGILYTHSEGSVVESPTSFDQACLNEVHKRYAPRWAGLLYARCYERSSYPRHRILGTVGLVRNQLGLGTLAGSPEDVD